MKCRSTVPTLVSSTTRWRNAGMAISLALAVATVAWAADNRTLLEPGWNMFSPQQDVEIGQEVSADAERDLPMLNNSNVDRYVNDLGQRLAATAPGEKYPYQFKVVDDPAINAFALPGGPVYINRGVIEAADNEAQLAGVIAHETAHVALRHGTNQASKGSAAQLPLAILGGLLGTNSTTSMLAQLGANFAVNSVLLKYSRSAESQADIMATQILFDAGYDPRAMGQFFQKIEQQGGGPPEFFSNHPSPVNRIERVDQEVTALGGVPRNARTNSNEFDQVKRNLGSATTSNGQQLQGPSQTATPTELAILSASYGANGRFIDVRDRMQSQVRNGRLDLKVDNRAMGGDPIGEAKTLHVTYRLSNQVYNVDVRENQRISIPTDQQLRDASNTAPARSATRFVSIQNSVLRIDRPEDWEAFGQGDAMTITPNGGLVEDRQGNRALAYGVIVNLFEPDWYGYGQQLQGPGFGQPPAQNSTTRLEQSTDQLVQQLRLSNQNMRVVRYSESLQVDGERALSTYLSNDSPLGSRETDWLVTMEHPAGVLFIVFTAPEQQFQSYESVFHQMLRSIRISR